MKKGKFITFEGIDGSGKSTQVKNLSNFLNSHSIEVIVTREPGGTVVAEKIREILLDRNNIELTGRAELLLYLASRAQHTDEIIIPALHRGYWVISDRFIDSSVAYQGAAREIGQKTVREMNLFATGGLVPDITFFLDISPQEAERRMQNRRLDRLETEAIEFVQRVRNGYHWIVRNEGERFHIINGELEADKVWKEIQRIIFNKNWEIIKS